MSPSGTPAAGARPRTRLHLVTLHGSAPARDRGATHARAAACGQPPASSPRSAPQKQRAGCKLPCPADSSSSSAASPGYRPSWRGLGRAANLSAGSSLHAFAPALHKLRETTEGGKQSGADSWAWCELHYKTCVPRTDGSTES